MVSVYRVYARDYAAHANLTLSQYKVSSYDIINSNECITGIMSNEVRILPVLYPEALQIPYKYLKLHIKYRTNT